MEYIMTGAFIVMGILMVISSIDMSKDSKRRMEQFEKMAKEDARHHKQIEKNVDKYLETYKDELIKKIKDSNTDIKGLLSIKGEIDG